MDNNESLGTDAAVDTLAALAQATRLSVFRLLVAHEPGGLAAGQIALAMGMPHNTLSTHLAVLTRAGLARGTRTGRQVIYRADIARLRALTQFLVQDCCGGTPAECSPLLDQLIFA